MIKGIYTAGRSLTQRTQNIDVIANNLANLNTIGFKREIPFSELIDELGNVQIRKLTSMEQGEIVQTSNPLDLAISGKGFFVTKDENGNLEFSRNGKFQISDDGFLVDAAGKNVLGKSGAISLEETMLESGASITINKNGEIKIGERTLDTLMIFDVDDPNRMIRTNGSNFSPGDLPYFPVREDEFGISQGFLEHPNTNPIIEMEEMIQINKNYESAQKVIASLDKSLEDAINIAKV